MIKIQSSQTSHQQKTIANKLGERNISSLQNFEQGPSTGKQEETERNGLTFKKFTNILGVAAWLGVVGYSLFKLKLLNRKSPDVILDLAKNHAKQAQSDAENAAAKISTAKSEKIEEVLANNPKARIIKTFKGMGDWFQGQKMRLGTELFNNITYSFGTLFVMPAVVLWSPFGKKNSSKEDKTFAVLRQPLSVAATLGMQYTFDKLIGKYVPEVIKQNMLEDSSIFKDGKFVPSEANYEKIRYNSAIAKDGFKILAKDFLTESEMNDLLTAKSFEDEKATGTFEEKLKEILNTKYGEGKGNLKLQKLEDIYKNDIYKSEGSFSKFKAVNPADAENIEKLLIKFKKYMEVLSRQEMSTTKSKVWVNILAAAAIGCTFLNVIYGKSMKAYKSNKNNKIDLPGNQDKAKEVK